jgi:hypothetical protein
VGLLRPRLLDGKGRGDGTKRGKRVRVAGVPKSPRPTAFDVKLPFAMTGPKTTAGKGVFRMAKVVADILRLIAELRPPVTSTA